MLGRTLPGHIRPDLGLGQEGTTASAVEQVAARLEAALDPFLKGLLAGSDPAAAGRMGLSGSIPPAANRG